MRAHEMDVPRSEKQQVRGCLSVDTRRFVDVLRRSQRDSLVITSEAVELRAKSEALLSSPIGKTLSLCVENGGGSEQEAHRLGFP